MSNTSEAFVASVARALKLEQIPCVLWGHYLLSTHGVPTILGSIDFIIPDDQLEAGMNTLTHINSLIPCPDQALCPSNSPHRPTQSPSFHMHINASEVTLDLYLQSETLWFLPPFDSSFLSPKTPGLPAPFVLASDKTVLPPSRLGRGAGLFTCDDYPVIVPKSHVMLEAFLHLHARDSGKISGSYTLAMIAYVELYIDRDGFLNVDLLPEPLRTFYVEFQRAPRPIHQWTMKLKTALGYPDLSEDDRNW